MKLGFFVMGLKGLNVLKSFIMKFGPINIGYVVSARDKALSEDCYEEIVDLCHENGILFISRGSQLPSVNDISYKFAIGWRWLIEDPDNLIVLHDSVLPKYRGFAPLVNMLVNGEKEIGVTALLASAEYDKGDILGQASVKVQYPIKISTAISQVSKLYSVLVLNIYNKILTGIPLEPQSQNEGDATYSLWLNEEDYRITWSWPAQKIKRFVDAVGFPYGRAETMLNEKNIKIDEVEVIDDVCVEDRERHVGKVIFMKDGKPVVICGQGLLLLTSIDLTDSGFSHINFRSRFK